MKLSLPLSVITAAMVALAPLTTARIENPETLFAEQSYRACADNVSSIYIGSGSIPGSILLTETRAFALIMASDTTIVGAAGALDDVNGGRVAAFTHGGFISAATQGNGLGNKVGSLEGNFVGCGDGFLLGEFVGSLDGNAVVGLLVGLRLGSTVGNSDGNFVGFIVGKADGNFVGISVGFLVGEFVGLAVGNDVVGLSVGAGVGRIAQKASKVWSTKLSTFQVFDENKFNSGGLEVIGNGGLSIISHQVFPSLS